MLNKLKNLFKRSAAEVSTPPISDLRRSVESLAEDFRALEWLEDRGELPEDFDGSDLEELSESTPEEIKAARYLFEDLRDRVEFPDDWARAYFYDCLDVENHYKGSAGSRPDLYKVAALISFGGPNIWAETYERSDWLTIRGYWGGDRETLEVYAPGVAGSLFMIGESLEVF
jgi:hypothetical protein